MLNIILATAVGLDEVADVKTLLKTATASELYIALVVASFFGNAELASFLIEAGADVNGYGRPEDFDGFHSHASPLHQAVSSGSVEVVKLLVQSGADLNATDKIFSGTPFQWAIHVQKEHADEPTTKKYKEIENYLSLESRIGQNEDLFVISQQVTRQVYECPWRRSNRLSMHAEN